MSSVTPTAGRHASRSSDSTAAVAGGGRRGRVNGHLVALLVLSLFAWAPLLYPGYLQVHSGFLPVLNLADLVASPDKLRWLPSIGTNYDLLRREGPLAYWLAWPLAPLLGDVGAVKVVLAASMLAGGLGMFAWTRRAFWPASSAGFLGDRAGLLAAMLYVLWPPLLAAVYVRGAVAEVLVMGLLPLALYAVASGRVQGAVPGRKSAEAGGTRVVAGLPACYLAGAFLTALLFLAQPGLALWALPLLLAWAAWPGASWPGRLASTVSVSVGAILGGGLLWLLHGGDGLGGGAAPEFAAHAVYPYQLLSPAWGFGVSTTGWQDALPLQLGLAALGLAFVAGVLWAGRWFGRRAQDHDGLLAGTEASAELASPDTAGGSVRYTLLLAILASLLPVLLATTLARPLWHVVPALARLLSYPWQLHALVGAPLALLAGSVVVLERRLAVLPVWAGLVALVVLSSYTYLAPRTTRIQPDLAVAAVFGEGKVALLRVEVGPLTPNPSTSGLRGGKPAPSPSEGEGRGEGEDLASSHPLTVTVAWQALKPLDFDYNVFVHAFDATGNRIGQWDGQPQQAGEVYPMTSWSPGEVVSGRYPVALDGGHRAGEVTSLWVGLYNWQTGERLPVNGDDKVIANLVVPEAGP